MIEQKAETCVGPAIEFSNAIEGEHNLSFSDRYSTHFSSQLSLNLADLATSRMLSYSDAALKGLQKLNQSALVIVA